jgi:hypothetical protein
MVDGVMQCFPNPTKNEGNIKIENMPLGNYTLSIYTPLWYEVLHIENRNTAKCFTKTVQVCYLVNGIYFVKLQVAGMVWYVCEGVVTEPQHYGRDADQSVGK